MVWLISSQAESVTSPRVLPDRAPVDIIRA
jgi:hypothetical protein